ncbi:MAG: phosphodiester glycosidase family protein [Candidatus Avoscillospira sp.]
MKLYGSTGGSRLAKGRAAARRRNPFKPLAAVLCCLLAVEVLYFTAVYSSNSFITKWRNIYISTAMDTMSHQWLATAFIPGDVIQGVMDKRQASMDAQKGLSSGWTKTPEATEPEPETKPTEIPAQVTEVPVQTEEEQEAQARASFFELFYEVDETSMDGYLNAHPEALDNGWDRIYINEAGLDDSGTDIETVHGEQVLAIDAVNRILLVRVEGSGWRGVLAVAKDPSQLSLQPSSQLGVIGETAAAIAEAHSGVLAMTGSGFDDPNGNGNGGLLLGYAMCDGKALGNHSTIRGAKRLELHEDDLLYIYDASDPVGNGCTDAVEWQPALVVDGQDVVPWGYDGIHPRACIGQTDKYEILMLVIEGRLYAKGILGTDLYTCADILLRHNCMQAMSVDGGASAMLWYDGEPVIQCSNGSRDGRTLPTAFVYGRSEE